MKISIATKVIIICLGLTATLFLLTFGHAIDRTKTELTETNAILLENRVGSESRRLSTITTEIQNTLIALADTPPIQGISRAKNNNGYDEKETSTLAQWHARLGAIFKAEMNASNYYDQIRYINETGFEEVRVNKEGSGAIIVNDDALQNKADRSYTQVALSLKPGQVYTSKAELNREGSPPVISTPLKPVIRYAIPVFDQETGARAGFLIANILIKNLLTVDHIASTSQAEIYIIDKEGYYIAHSDDSKEWGDPDNLNTGHNFYADFPNISKSMLSTHTDSFTHNGSLFVFTKVNPDNNPLDIEWTIIERLPTNVFLDDINQIASDGIAQAVLSFIIISIALGLSIHIILRPLKILDKAAQQIGTGNYDIDLNIDTNDEIGSLAKSFGEMTKKLSQAKKDLEQQIESRTKALKEKTDELEATLESFYTIRLGMQKDLELGTVEAENEKIKRKLDQLRNESEKNS